MQTKTIQSLQHFLDIVEDLQNKKFEINLFRGQSDDKALLPSIARLNPKVDTADIELEMLEDLRRRSQLLLNKSYENSWELLVLAQHFDMKTRLLDWTSNPLSALWFACTSEHKMSQNSFVYCLSAQRDRLIDINDAPSPFEISSTRILRPSLNNVRIIAQSGWFTVHAYSRKDRRFVKLETNHDVKNDLLKIVIPSSLKQSLLHKLSIFGINNRTMYPDLSGLCRHLNWKYLS